MKFTKMRHVFFLLFISLIQENFTIFAQIEKYRPGFGLDGQFFKSDSIPKYLKLPNPFLEKKLFPLALDRRQLLSAWVIQQRNRIWSQVSICRERPALEGFTASPDIEWNLPTPAAASPFLDYRESSLYIPPDVREYMDYQMGRSRYIPLGTLAAASYLARHIYNRYGYILQKREKERYRGLDLNHRELNMMRIVWDKPGILAPQWYNQYVKKYKNPELTFLSFRQYIIELENKYLLKTRKLENGRIKYFPALSKMELLLKLKDELTRLEGQRNAERLQRVQMIINQLEGL